MPILNGDYPGEKWHIDPNAIGLGDRKDECFHMHLQKY